MTRFAPVLAVAALLLAATVPSPADAGMSKALKCAFAKQRAAVKKVAALLDCEREALTRQMPVDPACTAAASARFQETFLKIEMRGGCVPAGDVAVIEAIANLCGERLLLPLQGSCTEQGESCGGGAPPCCTGLVCKGIIGLPPICSP